MLLDPFRNSAPCKLRERVLRDNVSLSQSWGCEAAGLCPPRFEMRGPDSAARVPSFFLISLGSHGILRRPDRRKERMAVAIRLTRMGRKNLVKWRIAVYDRRTRRDGRYLENLGTYNPHAKPEEKVALDLARYKHWVGHGALPSEAVARLLKHTGVLGTA